MPRQSTNSPAKTATKQTKKQFNLFNCEIITQNSQGVVVEHIDAEGNDLLKQPETPVIEEVAKETPADRVDDNEEEEDDDDSEEEEEEEEEEDEDEAEERRIAQMKREMEIAEKAHKEKIARKNATKNIVSLRQNEMTKLDALIQTTTTHKNILIAEHARKLGEIDALLLLHETRKKKIADGEDDSTIIDEHIKNEAIAKTPAPATKKIVNLVKNYPPAPTPSPTPPIGETIIEPPKEKRARENKQRPPLHSVICQKTEFKTLIKGKEYYAHTNDGHTIIGDGITYTTINKWNEGTYKIIGIENKTKRSIYECVMVLITKENKYYKLGDRYDTSGQMINPL
jgi:hypothetical protein